MSIKELVNKHYNKKEVYKYEWFDFIKDDIKSNYKAQHLFEYEVELDEDKKTLYNHVDYLDKIKTLRMWCKENDFKFTFKKVIKNEEGFYCLPVNINLTENF